MTETPAASTGWPALVAHARALTEDDFYTHPNKTFVVLNEIADALESAMLAAAPARVLSEEDVERMALARLEYHRLAQGLPAGKASYGQNYMRKEIAAMRAALASFGWP